MIKHVRKLDQGTKLSITLLVAILLFVGVGSLFMPEQTIKYPGYLTKSPSPTGVKGFYTMVDKEFEKVGKWKKNVQLLPTSQNQLMIIVEPFSTFNEIETERWEEWIEKGNHLLLLDQNPKQFFELETTLTEETKDSQPSLIKNNDEISKEYVGRIQTDIRLTPNMNDQILYEDQKGVIGLTRSYGKGALTVLITPDWITNDEILKYDHLSMLFDAMKIRDFEVIWFNEYVHGEENVGIILDLYPTWLLLLFSQVIFVVLLWLWSKGKRFGPIEIPREEVVRFGDERIRSIAAWYERSKFYKECLINQEIFLRNILYDRWGLPLHVDRLDIPETVAHRLSKAQRTRWGNTWNGLDHVLSHSKVDAKTYLEWTKLLNEIQNEVERNESFGKTNNRSL